MKQRTFIFFAAVILLGAAFLRIADLHRYPPGLHYDEAADMLLSRDIAFYGYNPFPVVTAYSGRESLFYYLAVPMLRIFGTNIMATRLTSAFLGILTVAATIALGKALMRNRGIALLAGAWIAISGSHVWLTRQGFRTSPQPLLEALGLWLLWIALRRVKRWMLPAILGGFFSGLALYVYMAARVFPPWLAVILILVIVFDGKQRRLRIRQSAVFFVSLMITAIPIGWFYATHLNVFTDRLSQLAPTADTPTLWQSVILHLGMFFIKGDPILRYNLDVGRPFFDPLSGALFVLGLIVAAWWVFRGDTSNRRMSAAFLLLCPLLIAPSVIAVNGFPPSFMRSVAMVPLIFFLPALGAFMLYERFKRFRVLPLVGIVVLVALGLLTWHDYQAWGIRSDLFFDADGDLNAAANWLESAAPPDALIYIGSQYYEHPTVLAHNIDPSRIRWMMQDHLILPPPDRNAIYIFPRSVDSASWRDFLGDKCEDTGTYTRCMIPAGTIFHAPSIALSANVAGVLRLDGADLPPVKSGGRTDARFYWSVISTPDRDDLQPVVALTDGSDNELGRISPYFQYSNHWLPGETIIQRIVMSVPVGEPPGDDQFKVTWVGSDSKSIALQDDIGRFAGLWATIRPLPVLANTASAQIQAGASEFLPGIYVTLPKALPPVKQGEHLRFVLNWAVTRATTLDQGLQVVFTDFAGTATVLWSGQPVHDTYPMSQWLVPSVITDRYDIPIPPDFAAGDYTVILRLAQGSAQAQIGTVHIEAVQRNFTVPSLAHPVDLHFGNAITLAGYELQPGNGTVTVKLAWQARGIPDRDYTVFVHLMKPDGTMFSQQDSQPSRPTSEWIANEVVTDPYTLPTPPGAYTISVGLYLQENGLRLPINGSDGTAQGDELILK